MVGVSVEPFVALQCLLRAYPAVLARTDRFQLLDALRDVKGLCRADLTEDAA